MTLKPMDVTPEVTRALQTLREASTHPSIGASLRQAINTLDNVGVFSVIDEVIDYDVDASSFCTCNDPITSACIIAGHPVKTPSEEISQHGEDLTDAYSPQEPVEPE